MANKFTLKNINDFSEKINIDDLYEKKKQYDLNKLELFNKILNRIHVRIKTTSRQNTDIQYCWYIVPEIIIGVPKYDQGACIAYIIDKLKTNGFNVRYIHPNMLFISWMHWVPSYVRNEIKKKTGLEINEFGEKIVDDNNNNAIINVNKQNSDTLTLNLNNNNNNESKEKIKKEYTPIKNYKPSGSLIYDDNLFNS